MARHGRRALDDAVRPRHENLERHGLFGSSLPRWPLRPHIGGSGGMVVVQGGRLQSSLAVTLLLMWSYEPHGPGGAAMPRMGSGDGHLRARPHQRGTAGGTV